MKKDTTTHFDGGGIGFNHAGEHRGPGHAFRA